MTCSAYTHTHTCTRVLLPLPAGEGKEWQEGCGQVVTGVAYRASDGSERTASAHLTIVCDGMYSNLRKHLSVPKVGRVCVGGGGNWGRPWAGGVGGGACREAF